MSDSFRDHLASCYNITYIGAMDAGITSGSNWLDRLGVMVSGACAVHCVAWMVFASVLGIGGDVLGTPAIHRVGLAAAAAIGAAALGLGFRRHRDRRTLAIGAFGLALMALALFVPHGPGEAVLTIAGVVLLASAHRRNAHSHRARADILPERGLHEAC